MRAFQDWCYLWALEVYRVLKPGGYLLAFSGTRTYHRMACAIEDAGFEVRDQIGWLYGSGFPKSKNLDGEHKGWGTALKPAWEPIVVARKPLIGTVAENVLKYGTGGINIDGCRIGTESTVTVRNGNSGAHGRYGKDKRKFERTNPPGRWPANVIHDGSEEVLEAFAAFGQSKDGTAVMRNRDGRIKESVAHGKLGNPVRPDSGFGGSGLPARFFYSAKANKKERGKDNKHPTVKPVKLGRYLIRLVAPRGGKVLDPFCGSGSFGIAAHAEFFTYFGIDKDPESLDTAERRLRKRLSTGLGF